MERRPCSYTSADLRERSVKVRGCSLSDAAVVSSVQQRLRRPDEREHDRTRHARGDQRAHPNLPMNQPTVNRASARDRQYRTSSILLIGLYSTEYRSTRSSENARPSTPSSRT